MLSSMTDDTERSTPEGYPQKDGVLRAMLLRSLAPPTYYLGHPAVRDWISRTTAALRDSLLPLLLVGGPRMARRRV